MSGRAWDLVEPRVSVNPNRVPTQEMLRRAAVKVTSAHLRGVPGLLDRAALVEALEALGLMDVGEKR